MGIVTFASMFLPSAIFLPMEVCAYMILNCKNMFKWKKTVMQEFWETECKSFRLNHLMEDLCKEAIKDMFSKKERLCCWRWWNEKASGGNKWTFFFAETFKLQFFPEIYYIIDLQCWSIALFDGSPTYTTDFPSKEDSGGSTQIYKSTKKVSD